MTTDEKAQLQVVLTLAHHDFERSLGRYAFFKLQSRVTSEDLVQETFMKTWIYLVRGGQINIMKAFLYHVINDLIVDEYRKHKVVSLDALLEKGFEASSGDFRRLFNVLDGKAAILLIDRLPEKYRTVMHMRYVRDLSLEEIALITGQSKNATTVQAFRGLEKLRSLYNIS